MEGGTVIRAGGRVKGGTAAPAGTPLRTSLKQDVEAERGFRPRGRLLIFCVRWAPAVNLGSGKPASSRDQKFGISVGFSAIIPIA